MSSLKQIEKFKRSRYWVGYEHFTPSELANICATSVDRAKQVIVDMRQANLIDIIGGHRYIHYKRKTDKSLLRRKWVSTPTSDSCTPKWT